MNKKKWIKIISNMKQYYIFINSKTYQERVYFTKNE